MKRLAFWIIVGMVALNVVGRRESRARDERRRADQAEARAQVAVAEARGRVVLVRHSDDDDRETTIVVTHGRPDRASEPPQPPVPPNPPRRGRARPPVPVPPSTEPSPSKATPDWFPRNREQETELAKSDRAGRRILVGPLSPSPTEAVQSLRNRVRAEVFQWLTPELPEIGEPTDAELQSLVRATHVEPVLVDIEKPDLGAGNVPAPPNGDPGVDSIYTIYKAGQIVDFSDDARAVVVRSYKNRLVHERLLKGGGALGFALIGLGALTGYIRADEATKGKYRRRLRALTALAIGGAGIAYYHWMV